MTWFTLWYNQHSIPMYLLINQGPLARQRTLKESAGSQLPGRKMFLTQTWCPVVFQLNVTQYLDFPFLEKVSFPEKNKLVTCFLQGCPHKDQFTSSLLKSSQKSFVLTYICKHQWKSSIVLEFQYQLWNYSNNTAAASEIQLSRWDSKMNKNNSHSYMRI